MLTRLCRFFEDYKKNEHKEVKVDEFLGAELARKTITESMVSTEAFHKAHNLLVLTWRTIHVNPGYACICSSGRTLHHAELSWCQGLVSHTRLCCAVADALQSIKQTAKLFTDSYTT